MCAVISIKQIHDKFPGLVHLYEQGPKSAFFLVKFWADLGAEALTGFYGVTTRYESSESRVVKNANKVCSFGKQVVEKIQVEFPVSEGDVYRYYLDRSPMCDYMISFVDKLNALESPDMMNSVLENFSVLQVVTDRDTNELLFCCAYIFEVATNAHGAQHHLYKLVD